MDDVSSWVSLAADGTTPSSALSIALDSGHPRPGSKPQNARVIATTGALNNTLRRSFATPLDLTESDELRISVLSTRSANGDALTKFFLEIALGSASLGLDDPLNSWRRQLPVTTAGAWEAARFSLADLPPSVRGAVSQLGLRVINSSAGFQLNVDEVLAVRDEMLGDIDATLRARLHERLVINGAAIPAILHPDNSTPAPARPYFEITNYDVVFSRERTQATSPRRDFFGNGFSLGRSSNAYDVYYQVTAVADGRQTQSRMLELVLDSLPACGEMLVNGFPLPVEMLVVAPIDQLGGARSDRVPLFYRVQARQEAGVSTRVAATQAVFVNADLS